MIEFNDHFLFSGNPQWNIFQKLMMMIRKPGKKFIQVSLMNMKIVIQQQWKCIIVGSK